jgi:hypothetical protein
MFTEPVKREEIEKMKRTVKRVREEIEERKKSGIFEKKPSWLCKWCDAYQNGYCSGDKFESFDK